MDIFLFWRHKTALNDLNSFLLLVSLNASLGLTLVAAKVQIDMTFILKFFSLFVYLKRAFSVFIYYLIELSNDST